MAEIVGLAASIAGLLSTAGAAAKLTQTIFRVAKHVKGAKKEIEDFGREIDSFAKLIQFAYSTLDKYKSDYRLESQTLQSMDEHKILDVLVTDCWRVIHYITPIRKLIRSLRGTLKLWTKIKWAWQSQDVKELGPKIQSVKMSIMLVMETLAFGEAIHSKNPNQELM